MTEQRIYPLDAGGLQPPLLDWVTSALAEGELVVAPTETRYGLVARVDDAVAVDKLYQAKARPGGAPVAVFLGGVLALYRYAVMTASSDALATRFLPGPLTLVLKAAADNVWPVVNDGWIGLRVSSSQVVQALVESSPFPLSATSANRSGSPELETIDEIYDAFGGSHVFDDVDRATGLDILGTHDLVTIRNHEH